MADRAADAARSEDGSSSGGGSAPSWEVLGRMEAQRNELQRAADVAHAGALAAARQLADAQTALTQLKQVGMWCQRGVHLCHATRAI